jgi:hypothetical protein
LIALAAAASAAGTSDSTSVPDDDNVGMGVSLMQEWKVCKADSDCAEIDTLCSDCCGVDAINKNFTEAYGKWKRTKCSSYHGGVCDCEPPRGSVRCVKKRCRFVEGKRSLPPSAGGTASGKN